MVSNSPSLFGGVMLAYFIVLLHLLLIAAIGVLILFFRWVVSYLPLFFLSGGTLLYVSTWYLWRRFKSKGRSLRDTLKSPLFKGKSIEIDLLGGMTAIRINPDSDVRAQPAIGANGRKLLLEDRNSDRIRALVNLARSLENDHLNQKANEKAGRNFFN